MGNTRFDFKITLEFRHQPVSNSVPYTIYTELTHCAKFEKNRWAREIYKCTWLYAAFYLAYRSPLNFLDTTIYIDENNIPQLKHYRKKSASEVKTNSFSPKKI